MATSRPDVALPASEVAQDMERVSTSSSSTRADDTQLEAAPTQQQHDNGEILKSTKSKGSIYSSKPSHFRLVFSHALVTPEVLNHRYEGSGTEEDPYVVDFIENDPRNPMTFSFAKKWTLTIIISIATLAVAFVSTGYSGTVKQIIAEFDSSQEVAILGISLFVLGFAVGPLLWAPFSELYGRQVLYIGTYGALTAFNAGAAGAQNMTTLIVLRFLAGAFGSSPLTNAGGVIADMFPGRQRAVAIALFAAAPFLGPAIGPIVGGFVGETVGWRWVEGVMAIFTGVLWILGSLFIPETYAPVILSKRAKNLSKRTGKVYRSRLEVGPNARNTDPKQAFKIALGRPWVLLLKEPIVLLLTIYMAIIYGTLYMLFAAFPIVYQQGRGWSEGVGGLAFSGVAVGFVLATGYVLFDNKRYEKTEDECIAKGEISAPPEARLPPCLVGSFFLPLGMFWFAWTNYPSIHWSVSIIATAPFGFGMLLVFTSIMNYLIDSYTIYAASVLAANSVLRSLFGAVFPLFTAQMYSRLGIHWASSIPAFLALMCVPFPFLFYKYGRKIRQRCPFAKEAMEDLQRLQKSEDPEHESKDSVHEVKEENSSESRPNTSRTDTSPPNSGPPTSSWHEKTVEAQLANANTAGPSAPATGAGLSLVSSRKSARSFKSARSEASNHLATPRSPGMMALERARSYASNF